MPYGGEILHNLMMKTRRLLTPVIVFAALLSISVGHSAARDSEIDRIMVIVNDDVITESEFSRQLRNIKNELRSRDAKLPADSMLRKQVLERMINDKIQLQIAARTGVQVSESVVDNAVRTLAARNNLSVTELRDVLQRDGIAFEAFRANVKTQLTIRRLVEREIASRVAVTEEEISGFLATQNSSQDGAGLEYNVSHILIRVPEAAGTEADEDAKQRAEQVLEEIRGGMDFEQAAVSYSQAQDALDGGNLGWRKPGHLPKLFLSALGDLKPGQVSDVLRSPNGFHLLKLNEIRGQRTSKVQQTQARHILIQIDDFITPEEARRRLLNIRERIANGEDFAELARAHSSDPVSSTKGGDLGWLNPGDTILPFEQTMNRLQVGEVSEPVRTPFGMHIIQVVDRRTEDVGEQLDRNNARQQIHARKSDERYDQWLRQVREESYVEYRSESLSTN